MEKDEGSCARDRPDVSSGKASGRNPERGEQTEKPPQHLKRVGGSDWLMRECVDWPMKS